MNDNSSARITAPVSNQIERKVVAGTVGAGAGAVTAQFVDWVINLYVLTPHVDDSNPVVVTLFINLVVTAALAFAAGYAARHTPRYPPTPVERG